MFYSLDAAPLKIAGESFSRGLGTHANSILLIRLDGGTKRFSALVGVDDEAGKNPASVRFEVHGDGRVLWKSPLMKAGRKAEPVSLDVSGVRKLALLVTDGGDSIDFDHADWVNAGFRINTRGPKQPGATPPAPGSAAPALVRLRTAS